MFSCGVLVRDLISRFPHHSSGDSGAGGAGSVSDRFHRIILQMSIALGGRLFLVTTNSLDHEKALATSRRHPVITIRRIAAMAIGLVPAASATRKPSPKTTNSFGER